MERTKHASVYCVKYRPTSHTYDKTKGLTGGKRGEERTRGKKGERKKQDIN
jgi:hypothetical protein